MVNLIENAISFSPPRGLVTVTARRRGPEVEVAIEDEGPGIAPENLERIFERFYTDRPHETFGQNSGLGLNISRQIIAAHGGRLYAENRPVPEGKARTADGRARSSGGARFVIRLKAA
jgi:two-component system sensor histidine kinase ChvG